MSAQRYRDAFEIGDTCYVKVRVTPELTKLREATVTAVLRGALKVKFDDDGRERTVQFSEIAPPQPPPEREAKKAKERATLVKRDPVVVQLRSLSPEPTVESEVSAALQTAFGMEAPASLKEVAMKQPLQEKKPVAEPKPAVVESKQAPEATEVLKSFDALVSMGSEMVEDLTAYRRNLLTEVQELEEQRAQLDRKIKELREQHTKLGRKLEILAQLTE